MDAAPPSYEKATLIDYRDLIAHYIPSSDLCSAALVSRRWHAIFTPHLWGNPASHFGIENDEVYVALTKFKRTLRLTRHLVRALTHTLHLPPAHAELYNGPHSDWLRDILERLPNLQSLIVRGLPFFDHSALQALKYKPKPNDPETNGLPEGVFELPASYGVAFQNSFNAIPAFDLRLLDASRCPNITSRSLAQALTRFSSLLYLDLSFSYPARDTIVLETLRRFNGLQVLKVRGLGLNDAAIKVLASKIARRVRSLDVRNNLLSDRAVRTLLDDCFITSDFDRSDASRARSPALLPYMGTDMLEVYQGEDFESYLRHALTGNFMSRQAFEDAPEGGITHLYIADNFISVEGVSGLLRSGRLHVLDVRDMIGKVMPGASCPSNIPSDQAIALPGAEKLTPVMAQYAGQAMRFLRIDHTIVTKDTANVHSEDFTVLGRLELDDTSMPSVFNHAAELDGTRIGVNSVELPTVQTPRHELPGDPMALIVSPPINDSQHLTDDEINPAMVVRRGSAFAPEVAVTTTVETGVDNLLSPVSALIESTYSGSGIMSPSSPEASAAPLTTWRPSELCTRRPRSYSSIGEERKARVRAHVGHQHNLHPAMLPHLKTLVLTDVPPFSSSTDISDRLIRFISQCAEEDTMAKHQARFDYALPPGRKGHATALKQSANNIFALQRIVIELAPEQGPRRGSRPSLWQSASTRSMTDDRDTETLWSAAEEDFSFFGDEEYSYPSLDPGGPAHSWESNERKLNSDNARSPARQMDKPQMPKFDTIALLSAFRRDRRLAHQRQTPNRGVEHETEGHWEGVVQVVRPGSESRVHEELDYYGTRFSLGAHK